MLLEFLINEVLGKIPQDLKPGEKLDLYKDGPLGSKGLVSHDKIDIHNGKRHFSITTKRGTTTKMVGDKITDQYGTPISDLRKRFDIERTAKTKTLGERNMIKFKQFIKENFGDDHSFDNLIPHHKYKTSDGHDVHVHLFNNPNGRHAVFFNKNLGVISKLVHWGHDAEHPTKEELEASGKDVESDQLKESVLNEEHKPLDPDSAGKITEHHTAIGLIGHKHAQHGTYGSEEHKAEVAPHHAAVAKLAEGKDPDHVELRKHHGQVAADAALEHLKAKHGPDVKISKVGHTSKPGDIGRFTNGKHNDTQENPSDVAVEVHNSDLSHDKSEKHHEGYSLKSSKKSNNITLKGPGIDMGGDLDHPTRKLNTAKISKKGCQDVADKCGMGHLTAAERKREIDKVRKKEGVSSYSSIEKTANEHGRAPKVALSKELHKHISHLTNQPDGHKIIGSMLKKHMTATTSMPWTKIHVQGDKKERTRATVTHGSESPLRKVFNSSKTKYAVTRNGERTTIHKVEKDGSHTPLAHYSPKTKGNVLASAGHGWNVLAAASH
jgi:hypothetical protein